MSHDLHLIRGEGEDILFFPETYGLYSLPKAQGDLVAERLRDGGEMPVEIKNLIGSGNRVPGRRPETAGTTSLCLYTAHDCNLSCTYCYNDGGRSVSPSALMTEEVAEAAFRRFFITPGVSYAVGFYGGEPLLNFPLIQKAVEAGERLKKERGIGISYSITTNGTILTGEMIGFMKRWFSSVTVSLDGPARVNDLHRRPKGEGSFCVHGRVAGNIRRLKEAGLRVTIKGTLTGSGVAHYAESLRHLEGIGADGALLTPVNVSSDCGAAISDELYGDFVEGYADLIRRDFRDLEEKEAGWTEQTFTILANLLTKRRLLKHCNAGLDVAVTADGSIYACHGLVGVKEFRMGSVFDEQSGDFQRVQSEFGSLSVESSEGCGSCWARYLCGGSCYAHGYTNTGSLHRPDPRHCALVQRAAETVITEFLRVTAEPTAREVLYRRMREMISAPRVASHG